MGRWLSLGSVSAVFYALAQLWLPLIMAAIIDRLTSHAHDAEFFRATAALAACAIVSAFAVSCYVFSFAVLSERATQRLVAKLAAHVLRLPISFHEGTHSGKLTSVFTENIPTI